MLSIFGHRMKTILRRISTRGFQSQQLRAQSTFICSRCRKNRLHPTAQFSSPLFQSSQHRAKSTDEKLPFGEKLRRKIWATDTPPGQKNPYERLTPEQRAKEIEEREAAASEELEYEDEASDQEAKGVPSPVTDGYVQAATWDGLDQIGGSEGWWEEAWDQENQFVGYVPFCFQALNGLFTAIQVCDGCQKSPEPKEPCFTTGFDRDSYNSRNQQSFERCEQTLYTQPHRP